MPQLDKEINDYIFQQDGSPAHYKNVRGFFFNPLTPNDTYRGRTAPLTSKVAFYIFIQQI